MINKKRYNAKNIKYTDFYKSLTVYQRQIVIDMANGANLNCNEGANYQTWLTYSDASERTIRKDSANIIADKGMDLLHFRQYGITLK